MIFHDTASTKGYFQEKLFMLTVKISQTLPILSVNSLNYFPVTSGRTSLMTSSVCMLHFHFSSGIMPFFYRVYIIRVKYQL